MAKTQNEWIHDYLRGKNRTLTAAEAEARYNIKNLRARMTQLRQLGLVIRTNEKTKKGMTKYSIASKDIFGSKSPFFLNN